MARPRQVTDEQILAAARRCFLSDGPGVPTSAIAEELGISQAALFKRFGTKQRLIVRACCLESVPDWITGLDIPPEADRPIRPQLVAIGMLLVDFMRQLAPRLAVLKANGIDPREMLKEFDVPPPVLGHRSLSRWLRMAVANGQLRECDADTVAFQLMGAIHGRTMLDQFVGEHLPAMDPETYVTEIVGVMLDGLMPEGRS